MFDKFVMRRDCLNNFDPTRNRDIGKVKISAANTRLHELVKTSIAYDILKEGHEFITEGILCKGKGRIDVVDVSICEAFEVVCSEKEESLLKKKNKYPIDFKIIRATKKYLIDKLD